MRITLNLLQIRCFDAVVREGSFRGGALALHMSQPSVSMHVAKLERTLGIKLLARTTRGSTLTEAGTAMLPHLRSVLRAEAASQQHAAAVLGNRVGRVRVAGVNSAVTGILPDAVLALATDHPELDVEVFERTSILVTEGTRDGTFDIGLAAHPVDTNIGLELEVLDRGGLMFVAHEGHPLLHRDEITRGVVAEQPFVTLRSGYSLRDIALRYLSPHLPKIVGEALNQDTVRRLVAARLGVTVLPNSTLQAVGPGKGLAAKPLSDSTEVLQVTMLHSGDLASPSTMIVADAIRTVARARFGSPTTSQHSASAQHHDSRQ